MELMNAITPKGGFGWQQSTCIGIGLFKKGYNSSLAAQSHPYLGDPPMPEPMPTPRRSRVGLTTERMSNEDHSTNDLRADQVHDCGEAKVRERTMRYALHELDAWQPDGFLFGCR